MSKKSQKVKPIETVYNGYRFRSRLEARWAVFFDAMGWPYEYEPEGYELENGRYLPDFWIPISPENTVIQNVPVSSGYFIEVKGERPTYGQRLKMARLANKTRNTVKLFIGSPWKHEYMSCSRTACSFLDFTQCPSYWEFNDRKHSIPYDLINLTLQVGWSDDDLIDNAIIEAKQARFEHGEKPKTKGNHHG